MCGLVNSIAMMVTCGYSFYFSVHRYVSLSGDLDNRHIMRSKAERDTGSPPSLPTVHLLPVVFARASKTRHISKLYRQGSSTTGGRKTNNNSVRERTCPVWVDLAVDASGTSRWNERCSSLTKRVLVDINDTLVMH